MDSGVDPRTVGRRQADFGSDRFSSAQPHPSSNGGLRIERLMRCTRCLSPNSANPHDEARARARSPERVNFASPIASVPDTSTGRTREPRCETVERFGNCGSRPAGARNLSPLGAAMALSLSNLPDDRGRARAGTDGGRIRLRALFHQLKGAATGWQERRAWCEALGVHGDFGAYCRRRVMDTGAAERMPPDSGAREGVGIGRRGQPQAPCAERPSAVS